MFSLSPAWSITSTGSEKFDDNKVEEAKVLDRVKERINKVLQSRLAGLLNSCTRKRVFRATSLVCTNVDDPFYNRQERMLTLFASTKSYSWRSKQQAWPRRTNLLSPFLVRKLAGSLGRRMDYSDPYSSTYCG